MRKVLAVLIGASLLVPFGAIAANAAKPSRYTSTSFNAYWDTRRKIDNDTYLRIEWYSGVYDSGEGNQWSDLYKDVERCDKRVGHDRCHQKTWWYDSIDNFGTGGFTVDRRLDTGHLDATYRLVSYDHGGRTLVGVTSVSVDLVGVGDLNKTRYSYTDQEGCSKYTYSGRSESRSATATGTYTIGDAAPANFGSTDNANMSAGTNVEVVHTC